MTRIICLMLLLGGGALTFAARSPWLLGLGILLGMVGACGLVLALAAARVSANARPETSMASVDDLAALRKDRSLRASPHARAPGARASSPDRSR